MRSCPDKGSWAFATAVATTIAPVKIAARIIRSNSCRLKIAYERFWIFGVSIFQRKPAFGSEF
jgi:hypothetical protein